jgi:thiol-disulfide isomerase/thioredoxin
MMLRRAVLPLVLSAGVWAQDPGFEEQQSLMQALTDGASSAVDTIRALEAHLARFPQSAQRGEVEQALAKAALEASDWDRLVKYGEPLLQRIPDDLLLLDRVAYALLTRETKENADRAYRYARALEDLLDRIHVEPGRDAARRQEERDRALSRSLLYQSRARSITQEPEEAVRLAARAFATYPSEEAAREWAEALYAAGRHDDAILRLAEAFAIPDGRTSDAARLKTRLLLGRWYEAKHGSEQGLGEVILAAYDRMSRLMEGRQKMLLALDPNVSARSALEFHLTGLDGKRFPLSTLKGRVVVMDFWATWCVPCRVQHPLYEILKQRFPPESGVVFLNVNADEERAVVEPFLEEQRWDKASVYYEDGLARLLNVTQIPATIVFDREGNLASRMDGFNPENFVEQMTARIEALRAAR